MKKIVSFLLMVIMALSLCSCALGGEIKELAFNYEGRRLVDELSVASWAETLERDYLVWETSGEVRKGQWYSVSGQESYSYSNEYGNGSSTTTISGKYFYSPYDYEQKLSLKVKYVSEYYREGIKYEETGISKIIYVEGAWYVKTEVTETSDNGKETEVDFESSASIPEFTMIKNLIANPTYIINMCMVDFSFGGSLYVSEESVEWNESVYQTSMYENRYVNQGIVEFEKDSIFVKGCQLYNYSKAYTEYGYYTESTSKLVVKKAMSGSVKRPNDYYKYE